MLPQWLNFLWILSLRGSIIYNDNKVDYDKRKCRHIRPGRACRAMGAIIIYDIRTVQELLGHKDVKTKMILWPFAAAQDRLRSGQVYTHVLSHGGKGVKSPVDTL